MKVLAVDLAAKYSAAVTVDDEGIVNYPVDSWGRTEDEWITAVTLPWTFGTPPDVLVVEDLPHAVPFMTNTKAVCRLQGRIAERMHALSALHRVRFIVPAVWRKHFALKNGTGPEAVVACATDLGYTPPDLAQRIARAGDKAIARKVVTDYCAAFLIGTWFLHASAATTAATTAAAGTAGEVGLDFPGSASYTAPVPRRPAKKVRSRAAKA